MSKVNRVISIGSPHGDDQVAWRLAQRLRSLQGINAKVITVGDPLRLCDHMEGCDRLVIVDACAGVGEPGTVTRLEWPDKRIKVRHSHSSHGFGLGSALQLADKLDRLPPKVVLFGVEVAACPPGGSLSEDVEGALSELERNILLEIQ